MGNGKAEDMVLSGEEDERECVGHRGLKFVDWEVFMRRSGGGGGSGCERKSPSRSGRSLVGDGMVSRKGRRAAVGDESSRKRSSRRLTHQGC